MAFFDFFESWYNLHRHHPASIYLSPNDFECVTRRRAIPEVSAQDQVQPPGGDPLPPERRRICHEGSGPPHIGKGHLSEGTKSDFMQGFLSMDCNDSRVQRKQVADGLENSHRAANRLCGRRKDHTKVMRAPSRGAAWKSQAARTTGC